MGEGEHELSSRAVAALFAERLRKLRQNSGLTLRQLVERSGYSLGTLSGAENGIRVPTWAVTEAFVQACGEDPQRWRQLWEVARTQAAETETQGRSTSEEPVSEASVDKPEPEPTGRMGRRRWVLTGLISGIATLAAAAVSIVALTGSPKSPTRDRPASKPTLLASIVARDGTDPYTAGCGPDQHEVERREMLWPDRTHYGTLVLFHSDVCMASWGYVYGPNSTRWSVHIEARRPSDGATAPSEVSADLPPNSWGNLLSTKSGCVLIEAHVAMAGKSSTQFMTSCFQTSGPVIRST